MTAMRTVLILLLLAMIAYANSLYAPFVFDDLFSVEHNQQVRFGDYFKYDPSLYLQPRSLLFVTFAFNEWIGGQNVFGYHVFNLLIHVLNGLLVFAAGRRIFKQVFAAEPDLPNMYALLAAAFFLVHPIQTESVTYISSRSELLSTFVYLSGLLLFMLMADRGLRFIHCVPILILLAIGFGFKETIVTLPASIFLYDYIFMANSDPRGILRRWPFYAGLFGPFVAGSILLITRADLLGPLRSSDTLNHWYYLLTETRVIARYIRLILFPSGLNLDHDFTGSISIWAPGVLSSSLLIVSLLSIAWLWRRSYPVAAFSIFWFFITLSITSSIIPIPDVIFEHRLYLPLAGVCMLFPVALGSLIKATKIATPAIQPRLVIGVATILIAALTSATIFRNYIWSDAVRLFSDTAAKSPHRLRPYINLIYTHMKQGEEEQAIAVVNDALENVPGARVSLLDTLGNLYLGLGRPQEAVESFKKSNGEAVRTGAASQFLATSFNNIGVAYLALASKVGNQRTAGREEALRNAREAFQKSLELDPDNVRMLDSIANVDRNLGQSGAVEQDLRKKLEENPNEFSSLYSLAALLSLDDRYTDAMEYFRRAADSQSHLDFHLRQQKHAEVLYFNYAFALSKTGQIDRASEEYNESLRYDPIFNEAHYNLALLYLGKGDSGSAVRHLTDIVNREPANFRANLKLAQIYAYQGRLPQARQYLREVLKTNPQDREALRLFASIGG
jgi:tetratricopeptide (TPR) repeat protein